MDQSKNSNQEHLKTMKIIASSDEVGDRIKF